MSCDLSVVIPALNEAGSIGILLHALQPARERGAEIIVVDGNSQDDTLRVVGSLADQTVRAVRGRAVQMNAGARAAKGRILLFLHADSFPPNNFDRTIVGRIGSTAMAWGRFDVRIQGIHRALPIVAAMMNARSRLTGIATGDQAIFATQDLFRTVGGFPEQPLMEDIEFSKRAKRVRRPICLKDRLTTSGRRWERNGVSTTVWLMWQLRLAYFLGSDTRELRRRYVDTR